jgi:hypothetical protein
MRLLREATQAPAAAKVSNLLTVVGLVCGIAHTEPPPSRGRLRGWPQRAGASSRLIVDQSVFANITTFSGAMPSYSSKRPGPSPLERISPADYDNRKGPGGK